jgi:predicted nucleic acid-binding protein
MPAVVSDASVLIGLAAVGQFGLLPLLYGKVVIPGAVWHEVTDAPAEFPGATEVSVACAAGWMAVASALNRSLVTQLEASLDPGEAEAIALAVECAPCLLLLDESDGRRVARTLGVAVTGTLGVLLRAKACGHVTAIKPLLKALIEQHHFRLHPALYRAALLQSGEQP